MDAVKKIVLIACLLSIAISVIDMLYPSKKFEKQVHLIFSLIFLLGIFTPILTGNVKIELPAVNTIEKSKSYEDIQESINEDYVTAIESNINRTLNELLEKNMINIKEISTKVNIEENNSISISEVNVISDSIADSQKITDLIKSEVGQEVSVIINQGE